MPVFAYVCAVAPPAAAWPSPKLQLTLGDDQVSNAAAAMPTLEPAGVMGGTLTELRDGGAPSKPATNARPPSTKIVAPLPRPSLDTTGAEASPEPVEMVSA